MRTLHPDPEQRSISEHLSQARCDGCADGLLFIQDVVELLPRNAQHLRKLRFAVVHARQNIIPQQLTRMRWAEFLISKNHFPSSSVILLMRRVF